MIGMLDRHGERQATATRDGMAAIAKELRDIRTDQRRLANRMLLLVGAVVLVAIVMMAGLTRETYLNAGLSGVKAGSGAPHESRTSQVDEVERPPESDPWGDESPRRLPHDNGAKLKPFVIPSRRDGVEIGPHADSISTTRIQ
jgi:hypothetical protein